MTKQLKRIVALYDQHFPYTIPAYYDASSPKKLSPVFKFLKDFQPHILIDGGDQLDLDCISHHNRNKPRLVENKRLAKDYAGYNALLDKRDALLTSVEQHVMLKGNHEAWIDFLVEENPQAFEGVIEVRDQLNLDARGYKWIEHRTAHRVGKLYFIHGDYKNGYMPGYHAKGIGETYQRNVVYGHFHSEQTWTKVSPVDTHPIQAQSVGSLATVNPSWMRNAPNAWINSFWVGYLLPDGNFSGSTVKIINNQFVFDGVLYR